MTVWYSPEIDEFMVVITGVKPDLDQIGIVDISTAFILEESSEHKVKDHAWYFIGDL